MERLISFFARVWGVDRLVDLVPELGRLWSRAFVFREERPELADEERRFLSEASRRNDLVALIVALCCIYGPEEAHGMVYGDTNPGTKVQSHLIERDHIQPYLSQLRHWLVLDDTSWSRSWRNFLYPRDLGRMLMRREYGRAALVAWFASSGWREGRDGITLVIPQYPSSPRQRPVVRVEYLLLPALVVGELPGDPFRTSEGGFSREFYPRGDWSLDETEMSAVRDYLLWARPYLGIDLEEEDLDGFIARLEYLSHQDRTQDDVRVDAPTRQRGMQNPAMFVADGLSVVGHMMDGEALDWIPTSMRISSRPEGTPEGWRGLSPYNVTWLKTWVYTPLAVEEMFDPRTGIATGIDEQPIRVAIALTDSGGQIENDDLQLGEFLSGRFQSAPGGPGDLAMLSFKVHGEVSNGVCGGVPILHPFDQFI